MTDHGEEVGTPAVESAGSDALTNSVSDWLLLEDGPLLAINKPAGLLTEGVPGGEGTLVGAIKDWLKVRYGKPGNVYLGIPHRLDRSTSGVIVFAKNSKTAARVAEQFEQRQVSKIYWALLEAAPEAESGLLVDWLRKVPEDARSEVCDPGAERAKEAKLEYRTLRQIGGWCLVEVRLLTGRMHQIRVQFASRGCPVVGDVKYGGSPWDPSESGRSNDELIALHARSLTLKHPIRYDELTIEASLPDYWGVAGNDVATGRCS
jgi:23S rRNA pseudouridine1911/1915/1917 synthase